MARKLRHIVQSIDLLPETYALRVPELVGTMPRFPSADDVQWDTATHGRQTNALGGFAETHDTWPARATLPSTDGSVLSDDDFDVATNGPRAITAPPLRADAIRAWLALELHHDAPEGSSVVYRLEAEGTIWRWDGAAWSPAVDPLLDWSERAEVQANFANFPPAARELVVHAWLRSSDGTAPSFLGVTVAYGVRALGDEDDALIRWLRRLLLDELRSVAVIRLTTADGIGAGPIPLAVEHDYTITEVSAVYNLTADPDELVPLTGVLVPGTVGTPGTPATWEPDVPIADGQILHIEALYVPEIIVSRHRDLVQIHREPAVLVMAGGGSPTLQRGQGIAIVRDLEAVPPTAVGLPSAALLVQPIEVSVIGELGSDVRRIESDLRAILHASGYRAGVSPETGRVVDVREITPFQTTTGLLSQGVQEARASWALGYQVLGADQLRAVHLVRDGGVNVDSSGG